MRMAFGVLSLLIVVAVIGVLAKRQLGALTGVAPPPGAQGEISVPISTPQQSQQMQNQIKKSLDNTMQQARPEADDK